MAESVCLARGAPLHFLSQIHDCAIDPVRWTAALRTTAQLFGGCSAAIVEQTPGENITRVLARWNVNSQLERAIIDSAPLSPAVPAMWLRGTEKPFAVGAGASDRRDPSVLWRTRVMQPEGLADAAIVPLERSARTICTLMVMRSEAAGEFFSDDIEALSALAPHFRTTMTIARLLEFKPLRQHCSGPLPACAGVGIILTDYTGRILGTNAVGEQMLDGRALLCLEDEIAARDCKSNDVLQEALAYVVRTRGSGTGDSVGPVVIRGPGSQSLQAWVFRLGDRVRMTGAAPHHARIAIIARAIDDAKRVRDVRVALSA